MHAFRAMYSTVFGHRPLQHFIFVPRASMMRDTAVLNTACSLDPRSVVTRKHKDSRLLNLRAAFAKQVGTVIHQIKKMKNHALWAYKYINFLALLWAFVTHQRYDSHILVRRYINTRALSPVTRPRYRGPTHVWRAKRFYHLSRKHQDPRIPSSGSMLSVPSGSM